MSYSHTQRAPLHYVLHAATAALLMGAWAASEVAPLAIVLLVTAVFTEIMAFSFCHLTVCDEGDALAVRYGPLPVFSKQIRYDQISSCAAGRTALVDGWGVHYVPGRGWTYNLWGYDCVRLAVGKQRIQIGTDDVARLLEHLQAKTGEN